MRVSEIMTIDFEVIDATNTLIEAAQKMKSFNIGFLPVQKDRQIIGVITDRDIVVRALAEGLEPGSARVRDIISPEVIYCYEDEGVEGAAKLMEGHQVRRLIVCDYDGNPVGIVSLGDLATKAGREQLAGEVLEQVSEPAAPIR
jgi:CBS domain-containing protein